MIGITIIYGKSMFFVKILVAAVGGGVPDAPRRGQDLSLQSRSKEGCNSLHFSYSFVKFLRQP